MNSVQPFVIGFGLATIFGVLSSLILKNWQTLDKTIKRMFSDIPKPKVVSGQVEADIKQSPLWVLLDGVITIIWRMLFQMGLVILWGAVIWFFFQQEFAQDLLFGVLMAAVAGFIWQQSRLNWKEIGILWKKIINPPGPNVKDAAPPNFHYLNANPPLAAYTIVINGITEISGRFIWQLILVYFAFLSLSTVKFYLWDGVFLISPTGMIGV